MEILNEKENKEETQEKLLSSIRDLAGSFTASSRELRDQVAAISENVEIMRSSQRSDSDLNFDCILVSGSSGGWPEKGALGLSDGLKTRRAI